MIAEFICPKCKDFLNDSSEGLVCSSCNFVAVEKNKIIDFRVNRQGYFFNPISIKKMDSLIKSMDVDNWTEIIKAFIKYVGAKRPDSWIDNLVVDGRYAWKYFLNLDKNKSLLDIGCGLGNLVSNLAPLVGKTYAMDLTYKRLEFTEKRITLFNPDDNVKFLAAGDQPYLPFPDNSIDCVTLSGVLEWVGEGDSTPYSEGPKFKRLWKMIFNFFGDKNPRKIQLAFLKEIKRILKQDGQLFIGIENRLNFEYFTGRPDHHSNLLYASLLPRFIANLYSIVVSKKPYRTYTYSIPGYKKLLSDAGFNNIEFLGLTEGYSFLNEIYPAENNDPHWQIEKRSGIKQKIKYSKFFFPAYGIIASEKHKSSYKLLDSIISEISKKITNSPSEKITTRCFIVTNKEKLIIKASINSNNIIIKLPFNNAAVNSEENNKFLLENTNNLGISPRFIMKISTNQLTGYVEEMLEGKALSNKFSDFSESQIYSIICRIIQQKNPRDQISTAELIDSLYQEIVEKPLKTLSSELKDRELEGQLSLFFHQHLYGKTVSVGLTHGDMSVSNILVDQNSACRLIDWEAGNKQGLPILDVINYIGSEYRFKNADARMIETIQMLTAKDFMNSINGKFIEQQYEYFGMSTELHKALVYLNWLHNIAALLPFTLKYNHMDIERFIYDVAKNIKTG